MVLFTIILFYNCLFAREKKVRTHTHSQSKIQILSLCLPTEEDDARIYEFENKIYINEIAQKIYIGILHPALVCVCV